MRQTIIYSTALVITLLSVNALQAQEKPAAEAKPSIESKFLSNIQQVTDDETFAKAGEGYFSPDGKNIVFQATTKDYPFYQIYTRPLAGGKPQMISTGRGRTTCAYFTTDGKNILFASSHLDPMIDKTEKDAIAQIEADKKSGKRRRYSWDFDPYTDIFVADLKGKIHTRLTTEMGYDAEGAYSKDGKKVAFCSMRDGDPDLYIMNADGSDVKQLTNAKGYDGGPFISPDGKWVIFRSDREKEHYLQIYVIGTDGKNETQITNVNGVNWAPYWHPTEPYIIWTGADHSKPGRPNYDLWLMKYEVKDGKFIAGKVQRVADHPAADVLPVFSPDGKKLMWTSSRTENRTSQLFIADFHLPKD